MPDAAPVQLITQAEAARRLSVSVRTVSRLRREGEIAFIPGRPVRVLASEIEAYVERRLVRAEEVRRDTETAAERRRMARERERIEEAAATLVKQLGPERTRQFVRIGKARR